MFMTGGFSLLLFVISFLVPESLSRAEFFTSALVVVSVFINAPHFMASYMLFYGDFRSRVFLNLKTVIAGVVVPVLVGGAILYSLLNKDIKTLGYLVNFMFLTVGWHYSKQSFGAFIALNSVARYFPKPLERRWLLVCVYSMWMLAWVDSNVSAKLIAGTTFKGIPFEALPFRTVDLLFVSIPLVVSVLVLSVIWFRQYRREKTRPTWSSIVSLVALVIWLSPLFFQPIFFLLVPIFHSLQYMLFVCGFKSSQFSQSTDRNRKLLVFLAKSFLLGWGVMWLLPSVLDLVFPYEYKIQIWTVTTAVFINIHHYFIDAVIWRRDNEEVKRHLFAV